MLCTDFSFFFNLQSMLKGVRKGSDAKDVNLNDGSGDQGSAGPGAAAQSHRQPEKSTAEASGHGGGAKEGPKPKTSQSDTAHGSFFLRMGTLGKPNQDISTFDFKDLNL